jgi:hypothetical protein
MYSGHSCASIPMMCLCLSGSSTQPLTNRTQELPHFIHEVNPNPHYFSPEGGQGGKGIFLVPGSGYKGTVTCLPGPDTLHQTLEDQPHKTWSQEASLPAHFNCVDAAQVVSPKKGQVSEPIPRCQHFIPFNLSDHSLPPDRALLLPSNSAMGTKTLNMIKSKNKSPRKQPSQNAMGRKVK